MGRHPARATTVRRWVSARQSSLTRPQGGRDYDLTAAHLQSPAFIMHQLDHLLSLVPNLYHGRKRRA